LGVGINGPGINGLKRVGFVVVRARDNIEFKPGGYHVMLMNVKKDLMGGIKVRFWLTFKQDEQIEVDAPVKWR
jgi:copper(I)-binding protein